MQQSGSRRRPLSGSRLPVASLALIALFSAPPISAQPDAQLEVSGMTFIGSRGDASQLVLRARRAVFVPSSNLARLEDVRAVVNDTDRGRSFEMTCDRADLDLETNDFAAEGRVKGRTGAGESYSAPWVRYQQDQDLLYSEAPVTMVNDTGTFSGDGFRYFLNDRRFQLLGNVRVRASR